MPNLISLTNKTSSNRAATLADGVLPYKKGNKMVDYARINNTLGKMGYYLSNHKSIVVSVSGGSDSDVIVHIICTHFREHLPKVHFVFANTGLEYKATLRHLDYLEERYGIKINRVRGMSIPSAVKKYGVPFVSKKVSDYLGRLQKHKFTWVDGNIDYLNSQFGKCRVALRWWCNDWGEKSRFNIDWNKGLKDYLINNPPKIKISAICCTKSKKEPLIKFQKSVEADLSISGERKSEGGARVSKSSCFGHDHGIDRYMPLFYWNNETKDYYIKSEGIVRSDCYEIWGMKRTGCVGCPFGKDIVQELKLMKHYEPNMYKACINVFGESYRMIDTYGIREEKIFDI